MVKVSKVVKVFIIQANFYKDISALLLEGAEEAIKNQNIFAESIDYEIISVDGALEIPTAINIIANSIAKNSNIEISKINNIAFVALGCVIRGETSHYDIVCNESARGINNLAINHLLPIGNGIITVENHQQATARASKLQKNKGGFATLASLKMLKLKQEYS